MRKNKNRKSDKKNMGFSLVEVLVTMLVIAIISIPIIRTFTSSARVNFNARKLQHATDTAQNVSELFTAYDLDTLENVYGFSKDAQDEYSKDIIGDEGEDFNVKVSLKKINSYSIPELKNFFGKGAAVCFKELTRYDKQAAEYITAQGFSDTSISKNVLFDITVNKDGTYNYVVRVTYSCPGAESYAQEMTIDYSADDQKDEGNTIPTLYILYTNYSTVMADSVTVNYNTDDINADEGKAVDIYFIQQENTENISVNPNVIYNGGNYSIIDEKLRNMEFHIYDRTDGKLTNGNRESNLYAVTIMVYYEGEVMTRISDIKQITESVLE